MELELGRELKSAARARHAVDDLALTDDVAGDVRLLVSELVTNSLRHAAIETGGAIRLAVEVTRALVRVEVTDSGPHFHFTGRADDPSTVDGWGLYLVATLADRWGIDRCADGTGNCVWFELDRAAGVDRAA